MDLNEQEKSIRDKMQNFQAELDTDMMWSNLEEFVPIQNKRRRLFLIILIGMLGLSFGVIGYFLFDIKNNNQTNPNTSIVSEIVPTTESNTLEKQSTDTKINYTAEKLEVKTIETSENPQIAKIETPSIKENNEIENKLETNTIAANITKPLMQKQTVQATTTSTSEIEQTTTLNNSITQNVLPSNEIQSTSSDDNEGGSSEILLADKTIDAKTQLETPYHQWNEAQIQGVNAPLIPLSSLISRSNPKTEITDVEERIHPWSIAIGIFGNSHSSRFISDNQDYVANMKAKSSPKISYAYEVLGQYQWNRKWQVWAGFAYQEIVRSYQVDEITYKSGITEGTKTVDIDAAGLATASPGTLKTTISTTRKGTQYEFNQNYALRLGISYRWIHKNRFSSSVKLGLQENLFQHWKGSYLDEEGLVLAHNDGDNHQSSNQFIPSYLLGLELQYALSEDISVGIQSQYQQKKNLYHINQINIQENQGILSIGLMAKYRFN